MGQEKNNRKKRGNQAKDGNGQVRQQDDGVKKPKKEIEEREGNKLGEYGQVTLGDNHRQRKIHLTTIIGEVEGHENSSESSKTARYDHIPPEPVEVEDGDSMDELLVLFNTSGGDVDAGPAIAEMTASLSLPTVSLVLGGSRSIGVPLTASTNYSSIVPSDTITIHPVRMTGMAIGTSQTYEYFEMTQDRILTFVSNHADITYDQLRELMHSTKMLTRDLDTVLVGIQAVEVGLINRMGGIKGALRKFYAMIGDRERRRQTPSFKTIHLNFNLKYSIV